MRSIEGKSTETHDHKISGEDRRELSKFGGDEHFAVQADVTGAEKVSVSAGRTIELAPYEFARVDFGLTVHFKDKGKADVAREVCQEIVNEILAREESMIAGSDRADKKIDWGFEDGFARSIYVGYGLTLKGQKRFESHRIDQTRNWQVDDDADYIAEIDMVSSWVVEGVKAKADEIRGAGDDTGL